ncbi:MAG: endonuclease/exonuclease/phosphatase family protein, partial [Burkholderiales bacterium]
MLTFNIAHARGLALHQHLRSEAKLRGQLQKIAQLIVRLGVDIVALQEIDEKSRWSGSFDHLAYLCEHTGLAHATYGLTTRKAGRYHLRYGNAVLSRLPIVHVENMPFGRGRFGEKGFLFVELETARGRLPLINLHLHHRSRPQRLRQVKRLMHFLDEKRVHRAHHWHAPPVVCGDFNSPVDRPDATATLLGYLEQHHDYT